MAHHHIKKKLSHQFAKSSALEAIHCLHTISKKNWQWFRCKKAWRSQQNWSITALLSFDLLCHQKVLLMPLTWFLCTILVLSSSFFVQCYWIINEIGLGDLRITFMVALTYKKNTTMPWDTIELGIWCMQTILTYLT